MRFRPAIECVVLDSHVRSLFPVPFQWTGMSGCKPRDQEERSSQIMYHCIEFVQQALTLVSPNKFVDALAGCHLVQPVCSKCAGKFVASCVECNQHTHAKRAQATGVSHHEQLCLYRLLKGNQFAFSNFVFQNCFASFLWIKLCNHAKDLAKTMQCVTVWALHPDLCAHHTPIQPQLDLSSCQHLENRSDATLQFPSHVCMASPCVVHGINQFSESDIGTNRVTLHKTSNSKHMAGGWVVQEKIMFHS